MTTTAFSDAELLEQARQGDEAAFTELYVRHQAAARRVATAYPRAGDPDDLVNGAFERVLGALRRGAGPDEAFRAYLFVTLRRLAADQIARIHDEPVDEVPEPVRAEQHHHLDPAERKMVVDAFESLPERWQAVLWQTTVEGRQPRDLAGVLGTSANAAAAMAYRAREKLRQAYLQAHLQAAPRPQCEPHRSRLGAYVRDGLSRRDRGATDGHVENCASCRMLVAELLAVNEMLVRSLHPVFTASAAAEAGAAATAGGAVAGGGGAAFLVRRLGSKARSNPAVVAGAVLVAALAFAMIASRGGEAPPSSPEVAAPDKEPPRIQQQEELPPPTTQPPPSRPDVRPTTTRPPTTTTTTIATPADASAPPTSGVAPRPDPTAPSTSTTVVPSPPSSPPSQPPPPAPDDDPPLLLIYLRGLLGIRVNLTDGPLIDIDVSGAAQESAPDNCGLLAILVNSDSC